MDAITKSAIYRLIKEGCAPGENLQISSLMYEEIRTVLQQYIEDLMRQMTNHTLSKTLLEKNVYTVLQNIPAANKIAKQCLSPNPKELCFYFPKASFKRFFHNIARDYQIGLKYSEKALNLIQLASEEHLKTVLRKAIRNTRHTGRLTLYPKDLQLARRENFNKLEQKVTRKIESSMVDYKSYIKKVMKMVDRNLSMSEDVKEYQNTLLNLLIQAIMKHVNDLLLSSQKNTIDTKSIEAAVPMVVRGELSKHAVSTGKRHVSRYTEYTQRRSGDRSESKRLESKCGLTFPISRTKRAIRNYTKNRLSTNASIFLTAVLEYISAEISELSGNVTRMGNRKKITIKDSKDATEEDEELSSLISSLGIFM